MKKASWKTTIGGALVAAGQFSQPMLPHGWEWVSVTLTGVGALVLGASARDVNVTSKQAGAE